MRKYLLLILLSLNLGITAFSQGDPMWLRFEVLLSKCGDIQSHGYRVLPTMHTAIFLQELGEERGTEFMHKAALSYKNDEELIILCRMLFEPEKHQEFRRPMIGAPHFIGKSEDPYWPLEPIALEDNIPFLVVQGYSLGGLPESAEMYLQYCIENCEWKQKKYAAVNQEQLNAAQAKLIARIEESGQQLNTYERSFLEKQIN